MTPDENAVFRRALAVTLEFEGGWYPGHLPGDPNPTMKGITQKTYDAYRKASSLPVQSVRHISDAEVAEIYRFRFWDRVQAGRWPWPMCLLVFDWAVNSGPRHALQGLAGIEGPAEALYLKRRWEFLERLMAARPETAVFRRGWARRVNRLCSISGIPPIAR